MLNRTTIVAVIGIAASMAHFGAAARLSAGEVQVTATATVDQLPDRLRLQVDLIGKGPSLEDALKQLARQQEKARAQLEQLSAIGDSIKIKPPVVADDSSERDEELRRFMEARAGSGRRIPPGLAAAKSTTATAELTAEWPLSGDSPAEILIAAKKLVEQIKKADVSGAEAAKADDPTERELEEERMMREYRQSYGERSVEPGTPRFLYVAKFPDNARDEALENAVANARTQAERLAKAAGGKLGALQRISSAEMSMPAGDEYYEYGAYMHQHLARSGLSPTQGDGVAARLQPIQLIVTVEARFALE